MNKILYSLILSESVIEAIDREAAQKGATRSGLIDEILSEHVSVVTHEQQIRKIFRELDRLVAGHFEELSPTNSRSIALRSSLDVKYKPSVRYQFELSKNFDTTLGRLKVQWRSKAPELLSRIEEFVRYWTEAEKLFSGDDFAGAEFFLEEGRFQRLFLTPKDFELKHNIIGRALYDYMRAFDTALKNYASGESDGYKDVEKSFASYVKNTVKKL